MDPGRAELVSRQMMNLALDHGRAGRRALQAAGDLPPDDQLPRSPNITHLLLDRLEGSLVADGGSAPLGRHVLPGRGEN